MPGQFAYNPETLPAGDEFLAGDRSDFREFKPYEAGLVNSNRRLRN
jgi:hypothetical protein